MSFMLWHVNILRGFNDCGRGTQNILIFQEILFAILNYCTHILKIIDSHFENFEKKKHIQFEIM